MKRIAIVGTSCSGKSTLAMAISRKLTITYVGLDHLHWKPNWVERPDDEFLALVEEAVSGDEWVVDGNYSLARDLVWPKANTIIWLDYPFWMVLRRALTRSISRAITKEKLFAGNVESFRRTFFSKDSVILWVIQTHNQKKQGYSRLLKSKVIENKEVVILTSQKETDVYLSSL